MRANRRYARRAFTLLEVMLASAILAVVLALSIHMLLAGVGLNSRCLTQGSAEEEVVRVVEMIKRELKDSGEGCTGWAVGANPNPASQYYSQSVSQVSFSRCIGYDPANDLRQWGPVITYQLQPAQGSEPAKLLKKENNVQVPVCNNVGDFHVRYQPDNALFEVTLTVSLVDPTNRGHTIRASHTEKIRLRN
jgi:prepilin-type N-terminal cleavage/methylation domain-containing protein